MIKKELVLNQTEQNLLAQCALYIPKVAAYNKEGELDINYLTLLEIRGELREIQKNCDSADSQKEGMIQALEEEEENAKAEREKSKVFYHFKGVQLFKEENLPSSKRDTFWKGIKMIDKILSKSKTIDELKIEPKETRPELLVTYILFSSIVQLINHDHRDRIEAYNKKIKENPYMRKEKTPPKVVSQLNFDIARTEYVYSKEKYSKGEYLIQNYEEIQADRNLFDCLIECVNLVSKKQSIEQLMNEIAKTIKKTFEKRGVKNFVPTKLHFVDAKNKDKKRIRTLNNILKEWTKEQDLIVRRVIMDIFDLKISSEVVEKILHDPIKIKEMRLNWIRLDEMKNADLEELLNTTIDTKVRFEVEDKLSALKLLDSYFKKENDRYIDEIWKVTD